MTALLRRDDRRVRGGIVMLLRRNSPRRRSHPDSWRTDIARHDECETHGKDYSIPFADVLRNALAHYTATIEITANVLAGAPRIAGTRVPLYMVLDAIQHHGSLEGALKSYPQLTIEEIRAALLFAADILEQPLGYEAPVTD